MKMVMKKIFTHLYMTMMETYIRLKMKKNFNLLKR